MKQTTQLHQILNDVQDATSSIGSTRGNMQKFKCKVCDTQYGSFREAVLCHPPVELVNFSGDGLSNVDESNKKMHTDVHPGSPIVELLECGHPAKYIFKGAFWWFCGVCGKDIRPDTSSND